MASTLDIKIRALVEGLENVNKLTQELTGTGAAAKGAGADAQTGAAGIAGLDEKVSHAANSGSNFKNEISSLPGPLSILKDNLGSLIGAFTALAAAYGLKESVDYAAKTEMLGTTLNVVAKNAGYSGEQIAKYEKEVKAMGITTQAARQSMTQMIQAGLTIGPVAEGGASSISKLARAAQDLAVVTGENSSATLTRLITNIQQMDTVGLRYMGLTVNIEAAQQKFALSIGKTADQLTQQQKTQAVLNEAMVQADKLSGAYAASMEDVGKKVQSLKRYQEELANTTGKNLLPAYGALVDTVTDFLKTAEASISKVDQNGVAAHKLADGVRDFFNGIADLLLKIVDMGGEIFPMLATVGGQVLSLAGDIIKGAAAIVTFGGSVDTASGKVSALGAILNTIAATLGYLVAAVRDGMSMIVTAIQVAMGLASAAIGVLALGVGKVVGLFNKDLGESIVAAGRELIGFGNHLGDVATKTVDAFGRGDSELGKFNRSLTESAKLTQDLVKASNYKDIDEQIRKLLEAKREHTKTDRELKAGADQVAEAMKRLAAEGKLTEPEMKKLGQALNSISRDSHDEFIKAIDDIGLSLQKIGGVDHLLPLNKELGKTATGLTNLGQLTETTATLFREAFNKGVDTAKSVNDINALGMALNDARKNGLELGDLNKILVGRFEEVFAASLKAAKTSVDYKLLEEQVRAVGDAGNISGNLMKQALDQIKDKAIGATEEVARLGKQAVDSAQEALNVARAHLDTVRADADVGRARIAVWQAQNKYGRDGSDLAAQELRYAQSNLQLAQAKAEQSRLLYAQEQQAMNVLITQQRLLNAEKAKGLHDGEEAYILAAEAAKKEMEAAQESFNLTKKKTLAQQETVLKLEEQAVKQKLVVDQTKASADEVGRFSDNVRSAGGYVDGLARRTGDVGKGMLSAAGAVDTFTRNLSGATDQQIKLANAIDDTRLAQQRLDAAQGNNGGVSSIDGGTDRNSSVGSTSQTMQKGRSLSAVEMTRQKAHDIKQGLNVGDFTEEDLANARAALSAANANSRMFASLPPSAVSIDGMQGVQAEFSRSQDLVATIQSALNQKKQDPALRPPGNAGGGSSGLGEQLLAQVNHARSSSSLSLPSSAVQSIASQAPSKVIQVNFTNNKGASIPVTVDADNETALLDLLHQAKGVSA